MNGLDEGSEFGVFTTRHVLDGAPVVRVYHDLDGDWQFHALIEATIEDGRLVGVDHLISDDPTLSEVLEIEAGYFASRGFIGDKWTVQPITSEVVS
jgi:hypothetical protein